MLKQKNILLLAILTLSMTLLGGCTLKSKYTQQWSNRHKKYVRVFDSETRNTLANAKVTLIAKNIHEDFKTTQPMQYSTMSKDNKIVELPIQGRFWFEIRNHTYMRVEKEGYIPRTLKLPVEFEDNHVFQVGLKPVQTEVE